VLGNRYKQYIKEIIYLLGDNSKKIPWFILLFISSSVLDLAGIGLIAPYVALITNPDLFLEGEIYKLLVSAGLSTDHEQLIILLGLLLITVFLIKAVSSILITRTIISFGLNQQVNLCSYLMRSYQKLPYVIYLRRNSSEYIHAIQTLTSQFSNTIQSLLRLISEILVGLAILMMLALNNIQALSLLCFFLIGIIVVYDSIFRPKIREYGRKVNFHSTQLVQGIHEGIEGLKEIRILGNENYFHKTVDQSARAHAKIGVSYNIITVAPRYLLELLLISFIVLLVIGSITTGHKVITILPLLSMFGIAAMRLVPSATQIISGVTLLRFNRHGTKLLYDDLCQMKRENTGKANKLVDYNIKTERFQTLEVNKCSFIYPSTEEIVLHDISIIINRGDSVGLIGPSGAGKTTLVDIILGLLEPNSGGILYNGCKLDSKLAEWRKCVAYLPQQVFLTDNNLRKNVAMGVEDDLIDEKKLAVALQQAQLEKLVEKLPQGLNTIIGERGIRLSGGQRQRIALARAFYFDRDVLVMDESTSALDNETEQEIIEEIKQLKGEKTMIVIAHRLTTLEHCDRIYRLDNGIIIEQGSFNQVVGEKSS
jgi:ATP-binding cassette, subfamily B, bacterial PglK